MGADDRRRAIMKYLCRTRFATIAGLAEEFSVSERTIRRDIETLSLKEPIYTQSGRYGGGVYVMEGYYMDNIYFSDQESQIIQKLLTFVTVHRGEILSDDEIEALQKMLEIHQKPI